MWHKKERCAAKNNNSLAASINFTGCEVFYGGVKIRVTCGLGGLAVSSAIFFSCWYLSLSHNNNNI